MNVWKHLLVRDFDLPYELQNQFSLLPLQLYISFTRSRISPLGIFKPDMKPKDIRHDASLSKWAKRNFLNPFYVLHLYHRSARTRRIEAKYTKDSSSYYKRVLEICEIFILLIEGQCLVRFPGYYKVVWRMKIANDYIDLNELTFITRIAQKGEKCIPYHVYENPLPEEGVQTVYTYIIPNPPPEPVRAPEVGPIDPLLIGMMPANPIQPVEQDPIPNQAPTSHVRERWFEVVVGHIQIDQPNTPVFLTLVNMNPAWKYGLFIDYVQIVPIHEKEYMEATLGFQEAYNEIEIPRNE